MLSSLIVVSAAAKQSKAGCCLKATEIFTIQTGEQSVMLWELDPVSRVTGIPGWYWIPGIKCSDTMGVGLVH